MSRDAPEGNFFKGDGMAFGIVAARYNGVYVEGLLSSVLKTLKAAGADESDIETFRVPGSHEVPFAVSLLAESGQFDCLIALGVVIAGATRHHELIGRNASSALIEIGLTTAVPVINGIIIAENKKQAAARCGGAIDRGREFALAALEMAHLSLALLNRLADLSEGTEEEKGDGNNPFDPLGKFPKWGNKSVTDGDFGPWKS